MNKEKLFAITLLTALGCSISGCIPVVATGAALTTGMIANDERSTGSMLDDSVIKSRILYLLKIGSADSENLRDITVKVNEGRVLLAGTAPNSEAVTHAVAEAWSVKGVREVISEIEAESNSKPWYSPEDLWIKSQIKTKYLLQKRFDSVNYTVVVKDGVVYLFGIAQDQEEKERAIDLARRVKGVSSVVNHVILREDDRRNVNQQ